MHFYISLRQDRCLISSLNNEKLEGPNIKVKTQSPSSQSIYNKKIRNTYKKYNPSISFTSGC